MVTIVSETPEGDNRPDDGNSSAPAPLSDVAEVAIEVPADLVVAPLPADTPVGSELTNGEVGDLFSTLEKSLRAHRIYQPNNPVYQGFIAALRAAISSLWTRTDSLQVVVEENVFRWQEKGFAVGEGRDNLSFLFFKDGIRVLTFLPGFEDEIETFLEVVHGAKQADQQGDDLVTLLWEKQFAGFLYSYVDVLAQGLDVPRTPDSYGGGAAVEPASLQQDIAGETEEAPRPSAQRPAPAPPPGISREDFEETLYFLSEEELVVLQREVQLEWQRNLKLDVLNALFDRLEEPKTDRQGEILRILRQLLPAYLSRGDLTSASNILLELNGIMKQDSVLSDEHLTHVKRLFSELSDPALLSQLIRSIEEGAIDPDGEELGIFLQHLGPEALDVLLRSMETTTVPALQERLSVAIEGLARAHPDHVVGVLELDEPTIVVGASRLLGRLGIANAAPALSKLLKRPEPAVRLAAVEALVAIHSGAAMEGIQHALEDAEREVRIAAARGLAGLRYQPARARLEGLLQGKLLRDADLTEKIAFFEAFGSVGNSDSVAMLDRLLNGKNMLRQRQPPEIRACAALALGKMATPAAKNALERATDETNPMVRSAVTRALKQEASA
jgi:hypothetical protein